MRHVVRPLNVEYVAAPAICLFFDTLIKAGSSTIGPRDVLIKREVGFISPSSAAPTSPLCAATQDGSRSTDQSALSSATFW
jgi:hypothetical protein